MRQYRMISILIPVYNEKENIKPLVSQLIKNLKKIKEKFEIVFIDDNSPDGTADEIKRLIKKIKEIRLLERERKLGLASAIIDGLKISKGDKIILMDGDLSHPPEKVPELVKALKKCDIVIGSRNIKGGGVESWPFRRKLISAGATFLAKLILGINSSDPMSGFFAIKREILEKTKISVRGYKILMNILAKNKGLKICEIPYLFKDRYKGETKLDALEMINFVADLIRIKTG